jgi:hypothetical protein
MEISSLGCCIRVKQESANDARLVIRGGSLKVPRANARANQTCWRGRLIRLLGGVQVGDGAACILSSCSISGGLQGIHYRELAPEALHGQHISANWKGFSLVRAVSIMTSVYPLHTHTPASPLVG